MIFNFAANSPRIIRLDLEINFLQKPALLDTCQASQNLLRQRYVYHTGRPWIDATGNPDYKFKLPFWINSALDILWITPLARYKEQRLYWVGSGELDGAICFLRDIYHDSIPLRGVQRVMIDVTVYDDDDPRCRTMTLVEDMLWYHVLMHLSHSCRYLREIAVRFQSGLMDWDTSTWSQICEIELDSDWKRLVSAEKERQALNKGETEVIRTILRSIDKTKKQFPKHTLVTKGVVFHFGRA